MALFIGRADFCSLTIREVHRDEEEEAGQNTCDQKAGSSFREELIFIHGPQCPFILIISNGKEVLDKRQYFQSKIEFELYWLWLCDLKEQAMVIKQ